MNFWADSIQPIMRWGVCLLKERKLPMLVTSDQAEGTEQRSRKIGISKCQLWNFAPQLFPHFSFTERAARPTLPSPGEKIRHSRRKHYKLLAFCGFSVESGSSTHCIHLQAIFHLPKFQPAFSCLTLKHQWIAKDHQTVERTFLYERPGLRGAKIESR